MFRFWYLMSYSFRLYVFSDLQYWFSSTWLKLELLDILILTYILELKLANLKWFFVLKLNQIFQLTWILCFLLIISKALKVNILKQNKVSYSPFESTPGLIKSETRQKCSCILCQIYIIRRWNTNKFDLVLAATLKTHPRLSANARLFHMILITQTTLCYTND